MKLLSPLEKNHCPSLTEKESRHYPSDVRIDASAGFTLNSYTESLNLFVVHREKGNQEDCGQGLLGLHIGHAETLKSISSAAGGPGGSILRFRTVPTQNDYEDNRRVGTEFAEQKRLKVLLIWDYIEQKSSILWTWYTISEVIT